MKLIIPQLKATSLLFNKFNTTTDLRRELTRLTNRYLKQNVLSLTTIKEFILAIDLYIDAYNNNHYNTTYFCIHTHNLIWANVVETNTYTTVSDYFNYILKSPRLKHTTIFLLSCEFATDSIEFRAKIILPVIKLALQKHLDKRTAS